jgi:hypothetical protein
MRHLAFKARTDAKPDATFAGRACKDPNLSLSGAGYKQVLIADG